MNEELRNAEPSEFDWDMMNLAEQIIQALNDLRLRVAFLERMMLNEGP
jgi:hypothetical protein